MPIEIVKGSLKISRVKDKFTESEAHDILKGDTFALANQDLRATIHDVEDIKMYKIAKEPTKRSENEFGNVNPFETVDRDEKIKKDVKKKTLVGASYMKMFIRKTNSNELLKPNANKNDTLSQSFEKNLQKCDDCIDEMKALAHRHRKMTDLDDPTSLENKRKNFLKVSEERKNNVLGKLENINQIEEYDRDDAVNWAIDYVNIHPPSKLENELFQLETTLRKAQEDEMDTSTSEDEKEKKDDHKSKKIKKPKIVSKNHRTKLQVSNFNIYNISDIDMTKKLKKDLDDLDSTLYKDMLRRAKPIPAKTTKIHSFQANNHGRRGVSHIGLERQVSKGSVGSMMSKAKSVVSAYPVSQSSNDVVSENAIIETLKVAKNDAMKKLQGRRYTFEFSKRGIDIDSIPNYSHEKDKSTSVQTSTDASSISQSIPFGTTVPSASKESSGLDQQNMISDQSTITTLENSQPRRPSVVSAGSKSSRGSFQHSSRRVSYSKASSRSTSANDVSNIAPEISENNPETSLDARRPSRKPKVSFEAIHNMISQFSIAESQLTMDSNLQERPEIDELNEISNHSIYDADDTDFEFDLIDIENLQEEERQTFEEISEEEINLLDNQKTIMMSIEQKEAFVMKVIEEISTIQAAISSKLRRKSKGKYILGDPFGPCIHHDSPSTIYFVSPLDTVASKGNSSNADEPVKNSIPYRESELLNASHRKIIQKERIEILRDSNKIIDKFRDKEQGKGLYDMIMKTGSNTPAIREARRYREAVEADMLVMQEVCKQMNKTTEFTTKSLLQKMTQIANEKEEGLKEENQKLQEIEFQSPRRFKERTKRIQKIDNKQMKLLDRKVPVHTTTYTQKMKDMESTKQDSEESEDEDDDFWSDNALLNLTNRKRDSNLNSTFITQNSQVNPHPINSTAFSNSSKGSVVPTLSLTTENLTALHKLYESKKAKEEIHSFRKDLTNDFCYFYAYGKIMDGYMKNIRETEEKQTTDKLLSKKWFLLLLRKIKRYRKRVNFARFPDSLFVLLSAIKKLIIMEVEITKEAVWTLINKLIAPELHRSNLVYTVLQPIFDAAKISSLEIYAYLQRKNISASPKLLLNVKKENKIKTIKAKIAASAKRRSFLRSKIFSNSFSRKLSLSSVNEESEIKSNSSSPNKDFPSEDFNFDDPEIIKFFRGSFDGESPRIGRTDSTAIDEIIREIEKQNAEDIDIDLDQIDLDNWFEED